MFINAGMVSGLLPVVGRAAAAGQLRRHLGGDAAGGLRYSDGAVLASEAHGLVAVRLPCTCTAIARCCCCARWCSSRPRDADTTAPPATHFDLDRAEIRDFIDEVAARNGFNRAHGARPAAPRRAADQDHRAHEQPAEQVLAWWEYRAHFVTEKRIADGVAVLDRAPRAARASRRRARRAARIPGRHPRRARPTTAASPARYRVLDALMTLAFDYPTRSKLFRSELEQFLLLAHEEHIDPLITTGSYAGAMGAPQFMPSSYRRFAIDADSDRHRDLWNDWDDIFASMANYLREHGWEPATPGPGGGASRPGRKLPDRSAESRAQRDARRVALPRGAERVAGADSAAVVLVTPSSATVLPIGSASRISM